jgi:hypothetical protein
MSSKYRRGFSISRRDQSLARILPSINYVKDFESNRYGRTIRFGTYLDQKHVVVDFVLPLAASQILDWK